MGKSRRTRARETAFQLLYQEDLAGPTEPQAEQDFLARRLGAAPQLVQFAAGLIAGVREHRAAIDAQIERLAIRWQLQRMPAVDRNIARIAVFEIQFGGTPKAVAIDEAVTLAKRYGGEHTYQFINGILDKIDKSPPATAAATRQASDR
jgi:N utilization substance protein B